MSGTKKVADKETLQRIRSLVIPPAWENVWISPLPDGHLQVTGLDARGRKQYRYHPMWNVLRNHTKFYHLLDFAQILPQIRQQAEADLKLTGIPKRKVLAAVVTIMENTSIRVGNNFYEKLYGSFGLTTLKDKHVQINGTEITFSFKGKKGVYQQTAFKSRRLSRIIKQCRDIPGKELFQYYDENGRRHSIDSGMVNEYIRELSGGDFTAKDFRTWAGTLHALEELIQAETATNITDVNKRITEAIDSVARHLGNTRTVCRKYYIHPLIPELYSNGTLAKYRKEVTLCTETSDDLLKPFEKTLVHLLEKYGGTLEIS
ncbi:DNA topoisomerase IB [Chitinophagaceae bacterium MMS25-I14]